MPSTDTELQQLIVYVGTAQQIEAAMESGIITENDFAISTDAPEYQTLLTAANAGTGIAITNENGVVKISNTQTSAEWGNITGNIENQTDLQLALEGKQNVIVDLDTIRSGAALGATALQPSDVIDNTSTEETDKPLSANMGKSLQDQVDNLKARGRFLALWNCATGLAQTNPPENTYEYKAGDYFIIGTVAGSGGTNYKPTGSSYTIGVASTVIETADVAVDDVYYYDGTSWALQINTQKEIAFVNIAGDPYDNSNLASALNGKVSDVQVNGTSIVSGTTANIPKATSSSLGVMAVGSGLAIQSGNGSVYIVAATESNLINKLNSSNPVVSTNLNMAVREGLGNNNLTWTDAYKVSACKTIGTISGVQINSTDLTPDTTTNKVNIPKASTSDFGVAKINTAYGIGITANGELRTSAATDAEIESKINTAKPIVPSVLNKAVMEGLGNNSLTWTDAYKASARNTIGAGTADVEFVDWE